MDFSREISLEKIQSQERGEDTRSVGCRHGLINGEGVHEVQWCGNPQIWKTTARSHKNLENMHHIDHEGYTVRQGPFTRHAALHEPGFLSPVL